MKEYPILKPGDCVEIINPATRCPDAALAELKAMLESWQLQVSLAADSFGTDLLCANTDEKRFQLLKQALENPNNKAVICARGGYGSARLLPMLAKIPCPKQPKCFIGMSDITALLLFLQQQWQWPTIHGALAPSKFSPDSHALMKSWLFGETYSLHYTGLPMNTAAKSHREINATITGGNLCMIQTGVGTLWQLEGQGKILLLEEVDERGYKVDRMLEHLDQAQIFQDVQAIIFGDFLKGNEPDGSSLIQPVLQRFADRCTIPVVQIAGIGHGYLNNPVPLGTPATLKLGSEIQLLCHAHNFGGK